MALLLSSVLACPALTLIPVWDTTILNDPNAAAIQMTINAALQYYEARFADPITVTIQFQEGSSMLGQSFTSAQDIDFVTFWTRLEADSTTPFDAIALAHIPFATTNPVTGAFSIAVKTTNLKALGISNFQSGLPGGLDGIITLDISRMNIDRTTIDPAKYDLLRTTEHEIDEVLGLGSGLPGDPLPEDLFRYAPDGARNFTTNGDQAYFSIDGAHLLVRFNQGPGLDYGDWSIEQPYNPRVQDAFFNPNQMPALDVELIALDVVGYDLLPMPKPGIAGISANGTTIVLSATNGVSGGTYQILTSTSVDAPLEQWTPIVITTLLTNGPFTLTAPNTFTPEAPRRFFMLEAQ